MMYIEPSFELIYVMLINKNQQIKKASIYFTNPHVAMACVEIFHPSHGMD